MYTRVRLQMLAEERSVILQARDAGRYDEEVLRSVLTMLDVEESLLDRVALDRREVPDALHPEGLGALCSHLREAARHGQDGHAVSARTPEGCGACLVEGTAWVHLRLCLTCGEVGCCDSSPRRHARRHFEATGHPVMRSFEPGEAWRWCFVDDQLG
jgi:CPA1 family monovalent cation:H+ antiporter